MKISESKKAFNPKVLLAVVLTPKETSLRKNRFGSGKYSDFLSKALGQEAEGALVAELKRTGFKASNLQTYAISLALGKLKASVLVIGWDSQKKGSRSRDLYYAEVSAYRQLGVILQDQARKLGFSEVQLLSYCLELSHTTFFNALVEGGTLSTYRYESFKSKKTSEKRGIEALHFLDQPIPSKRVVSLAESACKATSLARDLINCPPNVCTPAFLVSKIRQVAKENRLGLTVYDAKALKRLKANLLLAVSLGSSEQPYLAKLVYKPRGKSKGVVSLVGKGVTFDSGGLCVKTMSSMQSQKSDMSGAAAVIGVMSALRVLQPDVEVRAYLPLVENAIGPKAMRPGDVYFGLDGTSVEILNTDAEGRLILADAIALASREKADTIIDIATLTGANVVALGPDYAGLYSTDAKLESSILQAGVESGERFWPMPFTPEYRDLIKSHVAEIKNTGGPSGGAITAALFLKHFAKAKRYAHLDIAGPAFVESDKGHIRRGGTGFGVRTLLRFVAGQ